MNDMHLPLRLLTRTTATVLLSLISVLLPLTLKFESLVVQAQTTQNRSVEAWLLYQQGVRQFNQSQFLEALETFQQVLTIARANGTPSLEGRTLNHMGLVYKFLGQYDEALESYHQALAIHQQVGNKMAQGMTLGNIGFVYQHLGQYAKALDFFQQTLAIATEVGDEGEIGYALGNIAFAYQSLGQYDKSLEFYQEALTIHQHVRNKTAQGVTLNDIGLVYQSLEQYAKALEFFQQALVIHQHVRNQVAEGYTLDNIGQVHRSLEQYAKALEFFQQALAIHQQVHDRAAEGYTLDNIGQVYQSLGQDDKALEFFQQALAIHQQVGTKAGAGMALSNIGFLLAEQNQPDLAIVFYKQSVNVTEGIRQDLRTLPREQQESYTKTVADTYRRLAGLLLQQDRVLEARQVLDLLKIQELDDYLRNVRDNNNKAQGAPYLLPEQQIWDSYQLILNKAVEIGKELTQLRQINPENRTPEQEQRIAQLVNVQQTIQEEFNNFTRSPEVLALVTQRSPDTLSQDLLLRMRDFNALQDNLKNLQQNAVLLYPLILDDRIELILTTPDSPPIRRTVQVPKQQLNEVIVAFRQALQNPTVDAKPQAQELYNWLIKPLEADLTGTNAQTIIYAPDGQLRYIPLAALYDDQQWLVQRYRINNITAASLTDLNTQPQRQHQVLAGAFATGHYSFTVAGESFDFSGLPFAGVEVENLAQTIPATTKFIDTAFTPEVTVPQMDNYSIVHLATHAAFVVGTPDESFILFGNGERVTLRDIQTWSLKNVDLIVLSACETGIGGKLGNGEEILGLGYQMQQAGAEAAIASLWTVDDGGTQALMNAFYSALQAEQVTKAEALRQAQIALITGEYSALGEQRGITVVERLHNNLSPNVQNRLTHPYYWAPFILIGNGL